MEVGGQCHALATLFTDFIGGWVEHRAGLDECRKSHSPPGFGLRTNQAQRIAISTEISQLTTMVCRRNKFP
jgi:hypothetical protein